MSSDTDTKRNPLKTYEIQLLIEDHLFDLQKRRAKYDEISMLNSSDKEIDFLFDAAIGNTLDLLVRVREVQKL